MFLNTFCIIKYPFIVDLFFHGWQPRLYISYIFCDHFTQKIFMHHWNVLLPSPLSVLSCDPSSFRSLRINPTYNTKFAQAIYYQTVHLFFGFILEPSEHWKSRANSGKFDKDPRTLNSAGTCVSFMISRWARSLVMVEHQTWGRTNVLGWLKYRVECNLAATHNNNTFTSGTNKISKENCKFQYYGRNLPNIQNNR